MTQKEVVKVLVNYADESVEDAYQMYWKDPELAERLAKSALEEDEMEREIEKIIDNKVYEHLMKLGEDEELEPLQKIL